MSASAFTAIRAACAGRTIVRGPWSDMRGGVCALQAVVEAAGWKPGETRLPVVHAALGVDAFWIHRFLLGFDRGHQVMFLDKDGNEKEPDPVSKAAIALAKEMGLR